MKPKTIILMALAVTCGLGASFMTSKLLAERGSDDIEKTKILVAKKNLDMGMMIKNPQELFEVKVLNKEDAPKNAIEVKDDQLDAAWEQLTKRQVKVPRQAGDFISPEHLFDAKDSTGGLQATLPSGHRAVGIRVNNESIAGGFAALPHSRVDIMVTFRLANNKDSRSHILLENVLVLAADTNTVRSENGSAMPASVVTVALTPEEMLKVNVAKDLGPLSLALRKFGDTQKSDVTNVSHADVLARHNKKDEDPDGDDDLFNPNGPSFAPIKGGKKAPVLAAEPAKKETLTWNMVVIEGDRERRASYPLDPKTGQVIPQDIIRSEVVETPAATAPPSGTNPPAAPKSWSDS